MQHFNHVFSRRPLRKKDLFLNIAVKLSVKSEYTYMYLIFSSLNVYGMETTVKGEKNPWVMRSFVDSSVFLIVATVHFGTMPDPHF